MAAVLNGAEGQGYLVAETKSSFGRYEWGVLVAMTGSLSMIMIDQTVVSVALPSIQADLDLSSSGTQWVINAYILALASCVALGGRLGDYFGRTKVFVAGVTGFALASVFCGLSGSEWGIIGGRVVQGICAGFMQPASAAIVINTFPLNVRGKAMAVYAGVATSFLAMGPLIGGFLTQYLSWEWVFWVNLPIAALSIVLTSVFRPAEVTLDRKSSLRPLSFILFLGSVPLIVLAIQQGPAWNWSLKAFYLLGGGLLMGVVFVVRELHLKDPLFDFALFKDKGLMADVSVLFCVQFSLVACTVFGAVWLQKVLLFPPFDAGMAMLPLVLPATFLAQVGGRLYDRQGARFPAILGTGLIICGLAWQAGMMGYENYWYIMPGLLCMGAGVGLVLTPCNTDALSRASSEKRGQASGLIQTIRQTGSTMGMAGVGCLVSQMVQTDLKGDKALLSLDLENGWVGIKESVMSGAEFLSYKEAVSKSIAGGYLLAAAVVLLGFAASIIFLEKGRLRNK